MNDWMKQRDLLIEESMAFAQRVFSDTPKQFGLRNTASQPLSPVVAPPPDRLPMATEVFPTPKDRLDIERDLVQRRVASFKAIQKKFQKEREEYCTRTMSDARATQWTPRRCDNGT